MRASLETVDPWPHAILGHPLDVDLCALAGRESVPPAIEDLNARFPACAGGAIIIRTEDKDTHRPLVALARWGERSLDVRWRGVRSWLRALHKEAKCGCGVSWS